MAATIKRSSQRAPASARRLALGLAAAVALAAGCAARNAGSADLPPDINAVFLDEAMDVQAFVERFEGESRAVYTERHAILESLGLAPGDAVADIGAGTGFFSYLMADAVGPKGRVYAVEISPGFLAHLREQKAERALAHLDVVEGKPRSVALRKASTDLAFVCDVYHHFEHPQASLASLFAAIRPGGELVVVEFHRIPGVSTQFILDHVRAGRAVFQAEIEAAGFRFVEEIAIDGLDDNYVLRFQRP